MSSFPIIELSEDSVQNDTAFNAIYPNYIQKLSAHHWTPVHVAVKASKYLAQSENSHVLDIGSGVGKFCFVGAQITKGFFTGIEQRENLVDLSLKIAKKHKVKNVDFEHQNVLDVDFSKFNAFYFYNSFYENVEAPVPIDDTMIQDESLYLTYSDYVMRQLDKRPKGTRLVTYWSNWLEIPPSFDLVETDCNGKLNFWEKKK